MPDGSAPSTPLPRWDLTDLYPAQDSPQVTHDLATLKDKADHFAHRFKGTLATLSGQALAGAIEDYQAIDELMGKLYSFAQLQFSTNATDPAIGQFMQTISEKITSISSALLFFTLELNQMDEAILEEKLQDPHLRHWSPFLRDLRVFRPHQLSDELERFAHEKSVTGASAWNRLFDETMTALRVEVGGKVLTLGEAFNLLSHKERTKREEAGKAIGKTLQDNIKLLSLITNTLAKDKHITDQWRHYPTPASSRNCSNMVEDEVVDALISSVASHYPRLSHRYYTLKAQWLGLKQLEHWDRNAPLPEDSDRLIPWEEAKTIVHSAYTRFDPRMGELAGEFLSKPWIDVPPMEGKNSGAFAHPTVPSVHPYILLNYHGKTRDVMTLAHELGHGLHQVLAAEQGYLMANTPLTLAETASVFGEMLTFQSLLEAEQKPERRKIMLASKVEDMLNTVVRQTAFYTFEMRVHTQRQERELLPEEIGQIWREIQKESLGPIFNFTPEYDVFWSYIPHFIHSPFYVYAYAFGDCLVNALYKTYQSGLEGFADKYIEMLKAGGTKRHKDLLAPFGLDTSNPAFWSRGLSVIDDLITQLEQL
ncbi:M3 family oligoendopeptidase [Entomobacter blattae]|uniref:Oligoendopeptidase F, plasmid n=1 Tax=Entomobacter blattae TaxID=2762277 RepID=A0A7H1NRS3_9PROT|nr:M3 family oligoendopeptidase [Entomobacter blattae]QNT78483.1 Oligoendopeptidase F, plasmid [Entomobacter blattae]